MADFFQVYVVSLSVAYAGNRYLSSGGDGY